MSPSTLRRFIMYIYLYMSMSLEVVSALSYSFRLMESQYQSTEVHHEGLIGSAKFTVLEEIIPHRIKCLEWLLCESL